MKNKTRITRSKASKGIKNATLRGHRATNAKRHTKPVSHREDETQSAPAGKIATMPNRMSGMKADINTRFSSSDDYQKVKDSAAAAGVSMNKFIVEAALERAARQPIAGSERPGQAAAEPVATAG